MFGNKKEVKEIHKDDLSMSNFLTKMNRFGRIWLSNSGRLLWSVSFDVNLANGSTLEIRCDDKATPNEVIDGLIEKMKTMDLTLDGVTFEDFIK